MDLASDISYICSASRPRDPNCHRMVCVPGIAGIGRGGAPLSKVPDIIYPRAEHFAPAPMIGSVNAV
jgi:hypothetical protein